MTGNLNIEWRDKIAYVNLKVIENRRTKIEKRKAGVLSKSGKTFLVFRNKLHWFRKYNGYGFSKKLVVTLAMMGVEKIELHYTNQETKQKSLYVIKIDDIMKHGFLYEAEPKEYRTGQIIHWDEQYIVPKKYMKTVMEKV